MDHIHINCPLDAARTGVQAFKLSIKPAECEKSLRRRRRRRRLPHLNCAGRGYVYAHNVKCEHLWRKRGRFLCVSWLVDWLVDECLVAPIVIKDPPTNACYKRLPDTPHLLAIQKVIIENARGVVIIVLRLHRVARRDKRSLP